MPLLKINSFTGFGEHGAFDRAWFCHGFVSGVVSLRNGAHIKEKLT